LYPDASKELLTGCSCGSHFFYFIKKEYYDKLNQIKEDSKEEQGKTLLSDIFPEDEDVREIKRKIEEIDNLDKEQKKKIESDVREIIGAVEKEDTPVILDLESIRVLKPGKFEIDVVNLFSQKRPLIYKLEEGKYIIDLASTLKLNARELESKIKNPDFKKK
jgi:predicted  nucleic acid-binding Zn-ribbon protein